MEFISEISSETEKEEEGLDDGWWNHLDEYETPESKSDEKDPITPDPLKASDPVSSIVSEGHLPKHDRETREAIDREHDPRIDHRDKHERGNNDYLRQRKENLAVAMPIIENDEERFFNDQIKDALDPEADQEIENDAYFEEQMKKLERDLYDPISDPESIWDYLEKYGHTPEEGENVDNKKIPEPLTKGEIGNTYKLKHFGRERF